MMNNKHNSRLYYVGPTNDAAAMPQYYIARHDADPKKDGTIVAWVVSHTMAKRICNALNIYQPKRQKRSEQPKNSAEVGLHYHVAKYVDGVRVRECATCGHDFTSAVHRRD